MSDDEQELAMNSYPGRSGGATGTVTPASGSDALDDEIDMDMTSIADSVMHLPFTEARARALEAFDRAFLKAALAKNSGNIARTARSLGLHRQSLQKLMARRSIKSERATAPKPE